MEDEIYLVVNHIKFMTNIKGFHVVGAGGKVGWKRKVC